GCGAAGLARRPQQQYRQCPVADRVRHRKPAQPAGRNRCCDGVVMTIPMPEPVILRTVMPDDYRYGHVYGFTRRQVEAYAAAKVREALELAESQIMKMHEQA